MALVVMNFKPLRCLFHPEIEFRTELAKAIKLLREHLMNPSMAVIFV